MTEYELDKCVVDFLNTHCNKSMDGLSLGWYITSMYGMTCISTPINILQFYLIICHSSPMKNSFRIHLLCFHSICAVADIVISAGTIPVIYTPFLMGYPAGFLRFFGMSTLSQTYLGLICYVLLLCFTCLLFFHRLQVLLPRHHILHIPDKLYPAVVIFFCFAIVSPATLVFGLMDFHTEETKQNLIKAVPCISRFISGDEFLVLNRNVPAVWSLLIASASSDGFSFTLTVICIVIGLTYLRNAKSISDYQRQKQKKLLIYLVLQVFIPFLSLLFPFSMMLIAAYLQLHPARYVGSLMCLSIACHGTLSSSLIIYFNDSYLEAVKAMMKWLKKNSRVSQSD